MQYTLLVLLIISKMIVIFGFKVNVVHKWKYCEYEWESEEQKEDAINSGMYDPYKCLFIDANKAKDGRIFITVIKELGPGVPATVATVTNKTGPGGPLLRPYPDWSWHNSSCICSGMVNVFRVHIHCNYLIVLDNGKIGSDQICNPKLLIFNLKNDKLIKTVYIPLDMATNRTGAGYLVEFFVYCPKKCNQFLDEMIVFIADSQGSGLIVYDSSTKRMCRIESDFMKSANNTFCVAGQNFYYMSGIFGLTILDDDLYYASLSRKEIYKIKIKTLLECPNKKKSNKHSKFVKKAVTVTMATAGPVLFYTNILEYTMLGTNVYKKYDKNTVLAQDSKKLQIVAGMRYSSCWDQLIYLSNRYQRFVLGTVNLNEIHFRYIEMDLADVRKKTDLFFRTKPIKS